MISRRKVERKQERKTNPELVETIMKAKKLKTWLGVAHLVSAARRRKISLNLDEIDKETKEGDTVVIPGKVLGCGEMTKRARVVALSFSQEAKKKLKSKKCEVASIIDEIKINPQARGIKILK